MEREALKLALEALKGADMIDCDMRDAITAIKAALTQPAQEPVAYVTGVYSGRFVVAPLNPAIVLPTGMALYSTPQHTATWVRLTDEEIDALHTSIKVRLMGTFDTKDIYRVVEQALKEKNT